MSDRPSVRITAFLLAFLVANCLAQYYEPPGSNYNGAFSDPIRRALGLWGRLLNRMAQPNPPTDEQLHLKRSGDEEFDSGYLSQQGTLGGQPNSMTMGRTGSSGSIIDEQKLLALLPRFREPATAKSTQKTTTQKQLTKSKKKKRKTKKKADNKKLPVSQTESTFKPMKDSKTTKNPAKALKEALERNRQKYLNSTSPPPIQEQKFTIRMKTLAESANDNSTLVDVSVGKNISATSMERETEELITEIEKVLTEGEGWIMTDSENKTIATTASTVISTAVMMKNKVIHKDEDQSIEGSGDSSEEDFDSSESSEPIERKVASKSIATTKLPNSTSTFATITSSNTTVSTTTVPQRVRNPYKKKPANTDGNIPEAEEDEQAGDIAQLQLDSSTVSSMGQNVFNVNSNANSNSHPEIANVITPVNSIIDGIGPLILPLIGYSRQAVAAYYPRRVEGVPVYRPDYSPAPVSYKSTTIDQQIASPYTQVPYQYAQREAIPAQSTAPQQIHSHYDGLPVRTYSFPTFTASPTNIQHRAMHSPQVEAQAVRDFKHYPADINRGTYYQTPNLGDRLVMSETVSASKISQNTANNKQQGSNAFPSDAIRRALADMLQREKETATVREINGSNRENGELPYYPPEIGQHIKPHNSLSEGTDSSNAKTIESQKPNTDDPGYDQGRSNVVNTFYSDSGLMVQDAKTKPEQQSPFVAGSEIRRSEPAQTRSSFSPNVQGFGGGRRPDVSFEDVAQS
ncbi:hypothetical protein DdX_02170 [Ditylenchus destructor]|uniref:Uncharacterized protein n=1 Tax=Ditylenchus destructor TaxID=166010 RepID=A0AAD4NC81_9BILA|nr:hypothetical protein DdX_02170 [Ditylenchus destructor]